VNSLEKTPTIIVDTSNILFQNTSRIARVNNYYLLKQALEKKLPDAVIYYLTDASTRYKVDDKKAFERICAAGEIIQTPAGEPADHYLLTFAEMTPDCLIISCDRFKDHKIIKDLSDRVIPAIIIGSKVIFSIRLDAFCKDKKTTFQHLNKDRRFLLEFHFT